MPEGDTVHLAARRLDAALRGQVLKKTDFRVPRWATSDLSGHRVLEVVARGKHLLFRLQDDITIHTHFQMDGAWHLYRHGACWRGAGHEVRAVLETSRWIAVGFRLRTLDIIATGNEAGVVGHLGPDPLGPNWDPDEALRRMLSDPTRPIGDVLLDQRVIAGPGNVYRNEVCFLRGIHPESSIDRVPDPAGVVELLKSLMDANRDTGAQVTTGDTRRGRERWVYGRGGKPCRRCGTPIRRSAGTTGAERVTYWCPSCQPAR